MTNSEVRNLVLFLVFITIVAIAFLTNPALGAVFLGSGILLYLVYSIFTISQIKKNGIETTGIITGFETRNNQSVPVVEFDTLESEKISGNPFVSSSFDMSGIKLNQKGLGETRVLYHKKKPSQFLLPDHAGENTLFIVIMLVAALFLIIFGLYDYLS